MLPGSTRATHTAAMIAMAAAMTGDCNRATKLAYECLHIIEERDADEDSELRESTLHCATRALQVAADKDGDSGVAGLEFGTLSM